jgi:hypothetical protein
MKFHLVGAEMFHVGEETDGQTKVIVDFAVFPTRLNILFSAHRVYILYSPQNKQRLFPYTALSQ